MAGSTTSETQRSAPRKRGGAGASEPAGPQPCSACRASGRVLAGRGETHESLPCPWCRGTGTWEPGYDAQSGEFIAAAD
ncbi:MAG: hypothetical protein QM679_06560 [Patulibacter sp.]